MIRERLSKFFLLRRGMDASTEVHEVQSGFFGLGFMFYLNLEGRLETEENTPEPPWPYLSRDQAAIARITMCAFRPLFQWDDLLDKLLWKAVQWRDLAVARFPFHHLVQMDRSPCRYPDALHDIGCAC